MGDDTSVMRFMALPDITTSTRVFTMRTATFGILAALVVSNSHAATLTTLAEFTGTAAEGGFPYGQMAIDSTGNLFGVTQIGTVFELQKLGAGYAASATGLATLGAFMGGGIAIEGNGNLIGTTSTGGSYGSGSIFELQRTASGYSAPVTLVSFQGPLAGTNGSQPIGSLTLDANGNLYGTTYQGGAFGGGSAYMLSKTTNGSWANSVSTLASFPSASFGPQSGVVLDKAGNVYGTTYGGGPSNAGSIFEIKKTNNGFSQANTLFDFNYSPNNIAGVEAYALSIDRDGNLFGVLGGGGTQGGGNLRIT